VHRDLLDVRTVVHPIYQQVRHRPVLLIDCDPGPTVLLVTGQVGHGEGLVVGHRPHADVTEHTACRALHRA